MSLFIGNRIIHATPLSLDRNDRRTGSIRSTGSNFNFYVTATDTQDAATGLITTSTRTFTFDSAQNNQALTCTTDVGMACEVSESVTLLGKSF